MKTKQIVIILACMIFGGCATSPFNHNEKCVFCGGDIIAYAEIPQLTRYCINRHEYYITKDKAVVVTKFWKNIREGR